MCTWTKLIFEVQYHDPKSAPRPYKPIHKHHLLQINLVPSAWNPTIFSSVRSKGKFTIRGDTDQDFIGFEEEKNRNIIPHLCHSEYNANGNVWERPWEGQTKAWVVIDDQRVLIRH